jgi:hypothetical protein
VFARRADLSGSALAGQLLQNQLYGVRPRDPIAYAAAIALILAISPMGALRAE